MKTFIEAIPMSWSEYIINASFTKMTKLVKFESGLSAV